jgi:hypothetical protein
MRPDESADQTWLDHFPRQLWRFVGDRPERVEVVGVAGPQDMELEALPLVMEPGRQVKWMDACYRLDSEGRYCFAEGMRLVRQVIVFKRDMLSLFRSLAQIQVHGHRHNALSHEEKVAIARKGHLSITCGKIAAFTVRLLQELGVRCREAGFLTMDEWNGYDNGHNLLEYHDRDARQWILVDIDCQFLFRSGERFLDLREFHRYIKEGMPFEYYPLTALGTVDYLDSDGDREIADLLAAALVDEKTRHAWYTRTAQAVALKEWQEKRFVFGEDDPARIERILQYSKSYECISSGDWVERFYSSTLARPR